MESRLKLAERTLATVSKRKMEIDLKLREMEFTLSDYESKWQSNPAVLVTSRTSSEQLLIAAQLELQKVNWDLASEEALLESFVKEVDEASAKEKSIEREIVMAEISQFQAEKEVANQDLAFVEELRKRKAVSESEVEKAKQAVQKAANKVELEHKRMMLLEAQHAAMKNNQQAELKTQIRKLKVRKDQIEKYIKELIESIGSLPRREQLTARIQELQKTATTIAEQGDNMQLKADEIRDLLDTLNEVHIEEKK